MNVDLLTIHGERRHFGDETAAFVLARELHNVRVVARFTIDGEPVSKSRARFTKRGSKTVAYTPERTKVAEQVVALKFRQAAKGHGVDSAHEFGLAAVFFYSHRQRRDVDNMLKLLCDGLNGIAWADDNQVREVSGRKTRVAAADQARTEVLVYEVGTIDKDTRPCEQCGADMDLYRSTHNRRFCSQACHLEWRRTRRARVCAHCGAEFDDLHSDRARYCSRDCSNAARSRDVECSECGQAFSMAKSTAAQRKNFWCSDHCRDAHRKRRAELCVNGHRWDEFGTVKANGRRYCRECARLRVAARKAIR